MLDDGKVTPTMPVDHGLLECVIEGQIELSPNGIAIVCHDLINARARVAELEREAAWCDDDKDDDMTEAINAAHPVETKNHAAYAVAMKLVGNRRSKAGLVALVNYLVAGLDQLRAERDAAIKERDEARQALREAAEFAWHNDGCTYRQNKALGCDCGFAQSEKTIHSIIGDFE